MSAAPVPSTARRYPCPCRTCRAAAGSDCMQTRRTIKRHVEDEVANDIASGVCISDEQYAKMVALLHGAGLPKDMYSAAYSHHLQTHPGNQGAPLDDTIGLGNPLAEGHGDDSGFFEAGDKADAAPLGAISKFGPS